MTDITLVRQHPTEIPEADRVTRAWRADLSGQRFGRLTVAGTAPARGARRFWACLCDCGITAQVSHQALKKGATRSCGCLRSETTAAMQTVHGHAGRSKKSRTHRIWSGMLARCEIPSASGFDRYGAAGITVCERWHEFTAFLADMGECPEGMEIDRENGAGNYEPGNCRWVTRSVQAQNRRNAHWIEFGGETLSVTQWAKRLGIHKSSLYERLEKWPLHRALTEAKRP